MGVENNQRNWLNFAREIEGLLGEMFANCPIDNTPFTSKSTKEGLIRVSCSRRYFRHTYYDIPKHVRKFMSDLLGKPKTPFQEDVYWNIWRERRWWKMTRKDAEECMKAYYQREV